MIPNHLKSRWAAGRATINGWLSMGSAFVAEIMAEQGYDSLTVDIQHGFLDYTAATGMLQALRASGVTPLVRVPWLEPGIIMKSLDAGAYGVICPMVNSRDQAAALVDAMRYPPEGNRSFGPTRANVSAGPNYAMEANDNVLALAMIETAEALNNVEDICRTPGLDGVYIGPADLALGVSAGRLAPGMDREEAEMVSAIDRIRRAARAAGIRAGIHCGTPEYAARAIDWGFDMVTLSSDARILAAAAASGIDRIRQLTDGVSQLDGTTGLSDDGGGY
ncbi:MAG: aldolase/citrate lyase family protein [Paracoccaceae bacterium]|nr:aldolase/citrate lyase family protein [Paracoccaceae bacterium]